MINMCKKNQESTHPPSPTQPSPQRLDIICHEYLSDPGIPGVRYIGPDLSNSLTDYFADLTDVTLADEDSNSIPTDDVNRAILSNLAMQVAPSGGQHWN